MKPGTIALIPSVALLVLATGAHAQSSPEHVHLGLSGEAPDASTTHTVNWYTATPMSDPEVTLASPDGQERTFAASQVDGPTLGSVYEAVLDGLEPASSYEYTVGERRFSFTTPPASLVDGASVTLAVLGDMGITEAAQANFDAIASLGPDLVLHTGDVSYGEGDQLTWNTWFEMVEPVAAGTPWLPTLGNHETYTGVVGIAGPPSPLEIAYFQQRFALPHNELWFSFDWAGIHIVGLDTFSAIDAPTTEQLSWLEDDLAAHQNAAWTLAYLHEPAYSSNSHGMGEEVLDRLVPILEAGGVDLLLAGHDHGYERTYPIVGGEIVNDHADTYDEGQGLVHLVSGGGGQSLYSGWTDPAPAWSAARESLYHVTALTVTEDTLEGRVIATGDSDFQDAFRIVRAGTAAGPAVESDGGNAIPGPGPALAALVVALAVAARARVATGRER